VVSQSDVVKLLWANKSVLGDSLSQTVEQLELDDVSVLHFMLCNMCNVSLDNVCVVLGMCTSLEQGHVWICRYVSEPHMLLK
jgi:hypothetical protein